MVLQYRREALNGPDVLRQVDWSSFSSDLERFPQLEAVELNSNSSFSWTNEMMEVVQGELSPATQRALQFK